MLISRKGILSLLQKGQHFRTLADCAAVGGEQWGEIVKRKMSKSFTVKLQWTVSANGRLQ